MTIDARKKKKKDGSYSHNVQNSWDEHDNNDVQYTTLSKKHLIIVSMQRI